mmetsp:Transcript_16347/g.31753  ORF Transcript_16347/g.31753 Transcript_16347/m.31753 type:complete len:213 (+) Transcript_16347:72-710(+)
MVRTRVQVSRHAAQGFAREPQEEEDSGNRQDLGRPKERVYMPKSLLDLCDDALRKRASTSSREILDILELSRFTHRDALESACVRAIWRNFAVLKDRHSEEELRNALGNETFDKFQSDIASHESSKQEFLKLRSGQVLEARPCPNIPPDAEGNYPIEVLRAGACWPRDVDPTQRETRLTNETFEQLFGMAKRDFAMLPKFVRIREKKKHGLF